MPDTTTETALKALRRRVAAHRIDTKSPLDKPENQDKLKALLLLAGLKVLETKNHLSLLDEAKNGNRRRCDHLAHLSTAEILRLMSILNERVEQFYPPPKPSSNPSQKLSGRKAGLSEISQSDIELILAADIAPMWRNENSLGYIYQCFNQPLRKAAQSGIQTSNKKFELSELIAFTQIYTPSWVARFLLECTVSPILNVSLEQLRVIDPACGSGHFLIEAFKMIHAQMLESGWCSIDATEHLVTKTLAGVDIDPFATWVTALSLGLLVIAEDADADYSFKNLAVASDESHSIESTKYRQSSEPNELNARNLLGSLWRDWPAQHPLSKKYHVLVTNPPYIGRKLMSRDLKVLLKKHYPDSYHDLCTAFLRRSLDLMHDGGNVGFITQSSMMYLPSYEGLRKELVGEIHDRSSLTLKLAVEAGPGVFPLQGGEKVSSMLLVATASPAEQEHISSAEKNRFGTSLSNQTCKFIDIRFEKDKESALREKASPLNGKADGRYVHERPLQRFGPQLKYAFHYSCPDAIFDLLSTSPRLQDIAELKQGLATTNNNRFIRLWWEVNPDALGQKWFPYVKGAGAERWYSAPKYVVNWQNDGAEIKESVRQAYPYLNGKTAWVVKNENYYFKEGLSFSFVNTGRMAVRLLPAGCIFDVAGSAIFPIDSEDRMVLLAYLNSSLVSSIASLLNPTINFQVGDLKRLPILNLAKEHKKLLQEAGQKCVELKTRLSSFDCLNHLDAPDLVQQALSGSDLVKLFHQYNHRITSTANALQSLEEQIDDIVLKVLARSNSLSLSDAKTIAQWIQRSCERGTTIKHVNAFEFAVHLIAKLLAKSVNMGFSRDSTSRQDRVLLLNFDDRSHLTQLLQLDESSLQTLETLLEKPLSEFLRIDFTRNLMKDSHGTAPLVAFQPAGSKAGIVATLAGIHWLAHDKQTLKVQSFDEEINGTGYRLAQQILMPALRVLKSDPDAQGKTVVEALIDAKSVKATKRG